MFVLFVGFVIAFVAGFRRGSVTGRAIVALAAVALFLGIVGVVGNATYNPWSGQPSLVRFAVAFLLNFVPLIAGYALGATAKMQRLKNEAETDGAS
jgi:hypothetical protein